MDEEPASAEAVEADREWHHTFAVRLFNLTWDLLDKPDRTLEDDERMIHAAHASRFHWGEIGTPLEAERGEWQISHVYATLERTEPALHHAARCLAICLEHDYGDFDLAFAYEALARAHAVAGNTGEAHTYLQLAEAAGEQVANENDRAYLMEELKSVKRLLH